MAQAVLGSLTIRHDDAGAHLGSGGCGHCRECLGGLSTWCSDATSHCDRAHFGHTGADPGQDLAAVACLSAVERAGLGPGAVLIALLSDEVAPWLASAAQDLTGAVVLATNDLKDPALRDKLAGRPTGRADGVVVWRDAASAVRAVRRGGVVCVGAPDPRLPSITELVQREVRIVGPGGLSDRLLAALPVAATGTTA